MQANCLFDYIGLRACGNENPPSGLFINSLAGISLNKMHAVTDPEKVTYRALWNDIQNRAFYKMLSDFRTRLNKRITINKSRADLNLSFTETENITDGIAFVELTSACGDLNSITIKVTDAVDVYDEDGELLDASFVGTKTYFLDYIKLQAEDAPIYDVNSTNTNCDCACSECCSLTMVSSTGNGTSPIQFRAYAECNIGGLICGNKEVFTNPFMYRLGAEIMVETLYTERTNYWTTIQRDTAEELRLYYETEYEKQINDIADNWRFDSSDCCISCGNIIKRDILLP